MVLLVTLLRVSRIGEVSRKLNLLKWGVPSNLPISVVIVSFFHHRDTVPYNEIEVWCNRDIALTQKKLINRRVAVDMVDSVMTAWDIVGIFKDYARLTCWINANGWKPCSKSTKIILNPQIHSLAGTNVEEEFFPGRKQLREGTLVLHPDKTFNFVIKDWRCSALR